MKNKKHPDSEDLFVRELVQGPCTIKTIMHQSKMIIGKTSGDKVAKTAS